MPALRPTEVGQPSDRPPNIFAAGRPAPAAALSGGDGAHPPRWRSAGRAVRRRGRGTRAALPTLARASRRGRWARPGRRPLLAATALVLGALGCAAALNELGRPDRPGADTDANVQSAPPSTPAAPRAGSPRARSKDSAAAKPRRLNRHERAPAARAETVRGASVTARPVRRPRRDASPARPRRCPTRRRPPRRRRLHPRPADRPPAPQPAPRPPGPQPLPVAPGSPPGVHVNRDRGGHRAVCR